MAGEQDMSNWTDLLHSSTKLLEQAAPSAQFPPLQRNLDQLEALSKKLKAKTLRTEAPSQSIAATRLLAREGINAEQLARDLKSFELKTTFEDVFPAEATTVEEYLQQVHEMAMVSAVQEAQKDNLRSFNDYMLKVLEEDWQKEKRDSLQSLSRISTLPRTNMLVSSSGGTRSGQIVPVTSSPQVSSGASSMENVPLANKPTLERKATVYAKVVKDLNNARERGLPFKPATAFKSAYESLGLDATGGKSVNMQKIWHLVQALTGEDLTTQRSMSKKMSLVIGARCHLERNGYYSKSSCPGCTWWGCWKHAKNLCLSSDSFEGLRSPRYYLAADVLWLRTGYHDEARNVALSSRSSHQFAPLLSEWINTGGMVPAEIAAAASEECDKMLRMGDRMSGNAYDKKKLLLYLGHASKLTEC